VFFKVCKSMLRLTDECRSLSYDAMTAQMAIVFARYMMLAVEERTHQDARTLGDLFFLVSEELKDITLSEALCIMMNIFSKLVGEYLLLSEGEIDALMDIFLKKIASMLVDFNPEDSIIGSFTLILCLQHVRSLSYLDIL
jgi:hypothetical protein